MHNNNTDIQNQITAQIQQLVNELSKCAPHPDRPDHKGPLFLHDDHAHKNAADYDSTLGSFMLDGGLSDAFSEASNDLIDNIDQKMEAASTYFQDRTVNRNFQLGQHRVIANDFNKICKRSTQYQAMLENFMADLPIRLNIEKWIAHETRRLYGLQKQAMLYAMPMAA